MNYVTNSEIARWYGPPCKQPIARVRVAGNDVPLNKKAHRLFKFQELCFKQFPVLHRDLTERHLDDWGYVCRPVTGNSGPTTAANASKHAWGLADDIDADENVRGSDAFNSEIWVKGDNGRCVKMLERAGFTWGGRFSTPDPHHFEVAVPRSWILKRFDRNGKPRRWFAKNIGWKGPTSKV